MRRAVVLLSFCLMSMIHCVGQHEQTHSTDSLKVLAAQEIKTEHSVTHHQNKTRKKIWPIDWNNLPYSFDDMTLLVGINTSGIYYSNNYRELSYITGYSIGVEDFIPVFERAFFHFGLKYTRRGFEHSDYHVKFKTHNIDVPLFLSYELPALRMNDLRLLIGSQLVFRTGSTTEGAYTSPGDYYRYYPTQFSNFDFGFMFGLSAEFNNFYTTVRSFSGFVKLMPDDTGMNSTFSLEVGYFIFRNLRK